MSEPITGRTPSPEPWVYAIVRCEGPSNPEAWIRYDGWWYSYSHPHPLRWEALNERGHLTLLHDGVSAPARTSVNDSDAGDSA